jgi:hypothetical protein
MEEQNLEKEKKLRQILHNLDWIKILDRAVNYRKTSWNFQGYGHPVVEWRNASDEICMAVINALEDKQILEDMYSKVKRFESRTKLQEDGNSKD